MPVWNNRTYEVKLTPEQVKRWSAEILNVALEGMEPMGVGTCRNWSIIGKCNLTLSPLDAISVCDDCPIWTTEDALYADITRCEPEPTYEWWYNEWVEGYNDGLAVPYAFERMLTYVTEYTQSFPERQFDKKKPAHVWAMPKLSEHIRRELVIAGCSIMLAALLTFLLAQLVSFILYIP